MIKINKREMFLKAWQIAKEAVATYGEGTSRQYFAEALKIVWAEAKSAAEQPVEQIYTMPDWFLRNTARKLRKTEDVFAKTFSASQILKTSEKAMQIACAVTRLDGTVYTQNIWVPKSIL